MSPRKKVAVLISGRGSNMTALIAAAKADDYPAKICLVVSNRPDAAGLETARAENIKTALVDHNNFETRQDFEEQLHKVLVANDIEIVACAGFMRKLTGEFTGKWDGRMINIHPSLLPRYKGLNTHERVLEADDPEHGCTVHYVTADLDAGPVIMQACVDVNKDDSVETLAKRVLQQEHRIFPLALAQVALKQ